MTINRPKPMVPIVDQQVMAHIIELLKLHGITEIVNARHRTRQSVIQDHFGDGAALGITRSTTRSKSNPSAPPAA
ncbi:MAG: sugar phosphate nucleotidyltransferase [Kouleothrix sp.]